MLIALTCYDYYAPPSSPRCSLVKPALLVVFVVFVIIGLCHIVLWSARFFYSLKLWNFYEHSLQLSGSVCGGVGSSAVGRGSGRIQPKQISHMLLFIVLLAELWSDSRELPLRATICTTVEWMNVFLNRNECIWKIHSEYPSIFACLFFSKAIKTEKLWKVLIFLCRCFNWFI